MSVPKSKRSKPKSEAILKAKELLEHTLLVTSNENIFNKYGQLVIDIVHTSEKIFIDCFTANNIRVSDARTYIKRITLQEDAKLNCNNLLALIDLASQFYHLHYRKVDYWVGLVLTTRTIIDKWYNSDKDRYKIYAE